MRKTFPLLVAFVLVLTALNVASGGGTKKKVITPPGTATGRPFSAGMLAGDTLYVSGTTGTDPKTGKLPENFEDEVKQALANVHSVLQTGGMDFADAVSVQVYLTDMDLFQRMNAVYTTIFPEPRPTRTTVGVTKLAGGAHMEITVTARK